MDGAILITGKTSSFFDDLVQEALGHGGRVIATRDPSDEEPVIPDTIGDALRYVPWSRRSLLSARSMLLETDRIAGHVDHAVVVCSPEGVNSSLHQTESALIEERVDAAVKGYLFLFKELIAYMIRRGGGDVTVVQYDGGAEIMPPLDATVMGAVQHLTKSLFAFYESEPVVGRGLQASESDGRAVARWVWESAFDKGAKSAGRWQRYGRRTGLFSFTKA